MGNKTQWDPKKESLTNLENQMEKKNEYVSSYQWKYQKHLKNYCCYKWWAEKKPNENLNPTMDNSKISEENQQKLVPTEENNYT